MADLFNPYSEWLGIQVLANEPNYYELLGLASFADDTHEIVHAADGQLARVRAIRPGDKTRQWSQLLDEIRNAKKTLTDSAAKQQYDAQLREAGATVDLDHTSVGSDASMAASSIIADPAPSGIDGAAGQQPQAGNPAAPMPQTVPVSSKVRNPMPPGFPMPPAPGEAAPATVSPSNNQPTNHPASPGGTGVVSNPAIVVPQNPATPASQPTPVPMPTPAQPAAPIAASPGYSIPMAGGPMPMAGGPPGSAPQTAPLAAPLASPFAGTAAPIAAPIAGPIIPGNMPMTGPATAQPAMPIGGTTPQAGPVFGGSGNGAAMAGAAAPMAGGMVAEPPLGMAEEPGIGIVADDPKLANKNKNKNALPLLLLVPLAIAALMVGLGGAWGLGLFNSNDDPQVADKNDSNNSGSEGTGTSDTNPNANGGNSRIVTPEDGTVRIGFPKPGASNPDGPVGIDPIGIDPPVIDPVEPNPRPNPIANPRPTPEPEPEVTAEQVAEVNAALAAAKESMGRREFEDADASIAKAEAIATTGELLEKTQRARLLYAYLMEFWDAVSQSLTGLEGKELELDGTRAFVVEANAEEMTMRYLGRNYTFTKETLPSQLTRVVAEQWLNEKDPASKVFIGAFLAVDPEGDKDEARQLWKKAVAANVPVDSLIPVLDDRY